ncbi:universal stress protein [Streptomyces sp. NPDC058644]|uniref:universal stress protein n=1 Tax=unclassified Streptomyces TaxID=2593676 RepID=UPI003658DE5D
MTAPVRTPIVVGVDAASPCRTALAWGADDAHRRCLPLRLVLAQRPVDQRGPVPLRRRGRATRLPGIRQARDPRAAAEQALREAVAFVRSRHPRLEVSTLLAADAPVPVLRRQVRTAAALVLGSRGPSRRQGPFPTASVALPVIAHATCPVVLVRETASSRQPPFLVVGVNVGWDGRRHSAAAVIHAFEEAARRGVTLRVLHVWRPPLLGVLDEQAAVRECRRMLSDMVAGWRVAHPEVDVHHAVLSGHPAQVLTQESAHALALVVGTRGHGGASGPLRGSLISRTLRRARCPVVVVPQPGACHRTRGGPRLRRLSRGPRVAVGRWVRLVASFARARPQ